MSSCCGPLSCGLQFLLQRQVKAFLQPPITRRRGNAVPLVYHIADGIPRFVPVTGSPCRMCTNFIHAIRASSGQTMSTSAPHELHAQRSARPSQVEKASSNSRCIGLSFNGQSISGFAGCDSPGDCSSCPFLLSPASPAAKGHGPRPSRRGPGRGAVPRFHPETWRLLRPEGWSPTLLRLVQPPLLRTKVDLWFSEPICRGTGDDPCSHIENSDLVSWHGSVGMCFHSGILLRPDMPCIR